MFRGLGTKTPDQVRMIRMQVPTAGTLPLPTWLALAKKDGLYGGHQYPYESDYFEKPGNLLFEVL